MIPSHVQDEDGNFVIKDFREKYGPPEATLNDKEQESLKQKFYSQKKNQFFKVNSLVMPDVDISRKIIKSYHPKVSKYLHKFFKLHNKF